MRQDENIPENPYIPDLIGSVGTWTKDLVSVLRDIIAETRQRINKGFFYDRGDPSSNDWEQGDLTATSFTDLDLSSIVPKGVTTVLISVSGEDDVVGTNLRFRKNGNSNAVAVSEILTQVANVWVTCDVIVSVDSDAVVEYAVNRAWDDLHVKVRGWWK